MPFYFFNIFNFYFFKVYSFSNFTKISLRHERFPVNFWNILSTGFYGKPLNGCIWYLDWTSQYKKQKLLKWTYHKWLLQNPFLVRFVQLPVFYWLLIFFTLFICLYIPHLYCFMSSHTVLLKIYRTHNHCSFKDL